MVPAYTHTKLWMNFCLPTCFLILSFASLFNSANLISVSWYLIVVSICIPLNMVEIEPFVRCWLFSLFPKWPICFLCGWVSTMFKELPHTRCCPCLPEIISLKMQISLVLKEPAFFSISCLLLISTSKWDFSSSVCSQNPESCCIHSSGSSKKLGGAK